MTALLASNTRIGVYALVERLGVGGLGEVWKARDPRLNRVVALKFLSSSAEPRELLREARAASVLNHPNIVTIFDIGNHEGTAYLAMELVEGESLRSRMERGLIPFDEVFDIAEQVARGLAAAHRSGIVHRDLKPENIMLRLDGLVKIVDFGLAKQSALASGDDATVAGKSTATGVLSGTFSYMSPEQARGQELTSSSDVFAFGIILFEMVAGTHPFRASTVIDTLNAILTVDTPDISKYRTGVPTTVVATITRSLRKAAEDRFAAGSELLESLRQESVPQTAVSARLARKRTARFVAILILVALLLGLGTRVWTGRGSDHAIRSVAVMTLDSDPKDTKAGDFTQGFAEDLGVALARNGLQVASRKRILATLASANGPNAIASLGVDAVMEGTMRNTADGRRLYVEMADASSGFQVWSGTFSISELDVASGQRTAQEIAAELKRALEAIR